MKIFCSGIGGIGLSAYASHMKLLGCEVSGSDKTASVITEDLMKAGIPVSFTQDGSAVPKDANLVVYSEAIPESSLEHVKARDFGIRQMSYFAALGELTAGKRLICVCGTHGKSSTTAMAAKLLMDAGLDPNVVVGTRMHDLGDKNWRSSQNELWVVEACEYRRSFLFLKPSILLITNADGDHYDSYKDHADYLAAFTEFASSIPADGLIIHHGKDKDSAAIVSGAKRKSIDADADPVPTVGVPGEHMRQNAALVRSLGVHLGIKDEVITQSLQTFSGTWRRMEVRGEAKRGVTVIDDYAHHPAEIRATIAAMKEKYPTRRLVCVFEPHTHDRTLKLWGEFVTAFKGAGLVLVTKVYDARPDKDTEEADVAKFAAEIGRTSKVSCRPSGSLEKTKTALDSLLQKDDVLLVMGAGNSTKLATAMVE